MAGLMQLRASAKALGIPASEVRAASSADELQSLITAAVVGGNSSGATVAKKKRGRPKGSTNRKATATKPKRKVGRPKGSTTKSTTKATPKARRASSNGDGNGGRHLLGKINWSKTAGWNPREGSTPDVIVETLKKFKGDRSKTFTALVKRLDKLVPAKTRNGRKRSKQDREDYLMYLIHRNAWAFALATEQHKKSENRADYGTAGTGTGSFRRKGSRGRPKAETTRTPRKATAGAKKASQSARRGRPPAKRGPGRPKGSKNRPKATVRKRTAKR